MDIWSAITWFVTLPGVQSIVLIVTAVATAGSVIVALVISSRAAERQGTRDQIEAAARLERRAERQAVLIRVEVVPWPLAGANANDDAAERYIVRVHNPSPLAIYSLTPWLGLQRVTELYKDPIEFPAWQQEVEVMEPNSMLEFPITRRGDGTSWSASARCGFADAFGDGWEVTTYGNLTQTMERPIARDIRGH